MNGRQIFKVILPFLKVSALIVKIFPFFIREFFLNLACGIPTILGVGVRYIFLASLAKNVGGNIYIGRYVNIKNVKNLSIGDNVSIHDYTYIDAMGGITIGNDVSIAHSCSLVSFEHGYNNLDLPIKYNQLSKQRISIYNDVWIGAGVRILAGSKIERRVIVAANSVTKGVLNSNCIYAGSPAKKVREI